MSDATGVALVYLGATTRLAQWAFAAAALLWLGGPLSDEAPIA